MRLYQKNPVHVIAFLTLFSLCSFQALGQSARNNGCVKASFGIDAGLYSGIIEFGSGASDGVVATATNDWFANAAGGRGIIDTSGTAALRTRLQTESNPQYEKRMNSAVRSRLNLGSRKSVILIDGLFARDHFGGTGGLDDTAYPVASKNGEDPVTWTGGTANVLGKNDLIDVAAHMFRDIDTAAGRNDLWFTGLINRAEPGGDAYMDFEFYIKEISYSAATGFTTGGPELGHTAYEFDNAGNITKIGDVIYNLQLTGGGETPGVEVRIWVKRSDWEVGSPTRVTPRTFNWGADFDGPYTGSPYGYAVVLPKTTSSDICGYVNRDNQLPAAPPWGTKNTKSHVYRTSYSAFSVVEMSLNMTALGLDHISLSATGDYCEFPFHTFIAKTRASNAFTAQLKDFIGPFGWGQPGATVDTLGSGGTLSCLNLTDTLVALPYRSDVTYQWSTTNGNIIGATNTQQIVVDKPGTYSLVLTLPDGCTVKGNDATVSYDPSKPFFNKPSSTSTISCNGNDGTIDLTVTGATTPYTYSWKKVGDISFSATTQDLSGLSPGSYLVTITDANSCQIISDTAKVVGKTAVTATPTQVNPSCVGSSDGSLSLSVTGGVPPLKYRWNTGKTTSSLTNIPAGTYTVTITDSVNCTTVLSYTLSNPTQLTLSLSKVDDTDPSPSVSNGSATATPSGGTPTYTYAWKKDGAAAGSTATINNLSRALYEVTVTDSKGCTAKDSIRIWEPEICTDGIDNDGDGLNNCDDSDCFPTPPGTITPSDPTPCLNTNVTYTITNVSGMTYTWSVPSNATIQSGQSSNSITVQWNSTSPGQVCVYSTRSGTACSSAASCLAVSPVAIPAAPTTILKSN